MLLDYSPTFKSTVVAETTIDLALKKYIYMYIPVSLRPNAGHGLLILEVFDHTQRRITVGRTPLDV